MKKIATFLLVLLASACFAQFTIGPNAAAAEVQAYQNPTSVTFQRQVNGDGTYTASRQECYSYGCQTLPAWPGFNTGGAYLYTVWSTPRPAGTATMWGAWSFQSNGLFTSNPGAHVAFLMRGVSTGSYNIGGAGYTVGGLAGFANPAPCPGISGAPEVWWARDDTTAGNITWGGADCSPPLQDGHPYSLVMQATGYGFAWWLFDGATHAPLSNGYIDNSSSPSLPIIGEATGSTIGIVFADTPGTNWKFSIWNLAFGWF